MSQKEHNLCQTNVKIILKRQIKLKTEILNELLEKQKRWVFDDSLIGVIFHIIP